MIKLQLVFSLGHSKVTGEQNNTFQMLKKKLQRVHTLQGYFKKYDKTTSL